MGIEVSERLIMFLLFIPFFLISIAVHEFAHAATAYKLGDDTAKSHGRLTLNPIKHLDLVGSIIMPILAFSSGFALIGWAKPVPVNPHKLRNGLMGDAAVSAAGPLSNLGLAFVFAILLKVFQILAVLGEMITEMFLFGVFINIFLCFFNLIPIPPLDGSHLIYDFFPNNFTARFLNLGLYGTILLLLFIYSPLWDYFISLISFVISLIYFLFGLR
ncbi:MAG: site-2 protease family protein [Melioribacteraceae bacterium]|nr:site-2 protease family protein [Melioribacteraceae bacterium]MDD3559273.1 site-2 protease family protein [Melioribacteraceae bacterium]